MKLANGPCLGLYFRVLWILRHSNSLDTAQLRSWIYLPPWSTCSLLWHEYFVDFINSFYSSYLFIPCTRHSTFIVHFPFAALTYNFNFLSRITPLKVLHIAHIFLTCILVKKVTYEAIPRGGDAGMVKLKVYWQFNALVNLVFFLVRQNGMYNLSQIGWSTFVSRISSNINIFSFFFLFTHLFYFDLYTHIRHLHLYSYHQAALWKVFSSWTFFPSEDWSIMIYFLLYSKL